MVIPIPYSDLLFRQFFSCASKVNLGHDANAYLSSLSAQAF